MSRERIRPMPTAEQKARARIQMASADPFACAMKSVDDKFPDSREKDEKTLREEAEVEAMARAMARRIIAKKRMASAEAKVKKETVEAKPVESKTVEPEADASSNNTAPVDVTESERVSENTEVEKAIEKAFEEDGDGNADISEIEDGGEESYDEKEYDDEDYDDIDEMENGMYDDEVGGEAGDEKLDADDVDEDIMQTEILDGNSLKDELEKADFSSDEPDIMDDLDDTEEGEEVEETEEIENTEKVEEKDEESTEKTVNGRPVNMILGRKKDETEKTSESVDDGTMTVEVTPMRQNVTDASADEAKDKIRAKQMDFEAENTTKNPLIDDDKPVSQVKKVEPASHPKAQVKLTGLESKQKKMMIGIIALAILAVGGVLFGVIAMVRQNNTQEELAQQMAVVTNNSSTNSNVDDEYIYIRDWGLKIKIVSGLTDVSYNVATDSYAEVLIWGAKKDSSVTYTPDFARQAKNSNPLGTVVRVARYERAAAGRLIWYDDYYNYYYQGPTGIPSVSESEMSWWVESYLLIKEMLTNADNYTTLEDAATIGQQ